MENNSLYGNYRQLKFTDVIANDWTQANLHTWSNVNYFLADWKESPFYTLTSWTESSTTKYWIDDNNVKIIYYLLYASYGNSTVASSDINRFKQKLFAIMYQYAPTWVREVEIQKKLRNLSDDDIRIGGKAIYNTALNPQASPTTSSLTELDFINQQNTTNYKKSQLEAYNLLLQSLRADLTSEFIGRFKSLFLTVVTPEEPLWYETEISED